MTHTSTSTSTSTSSEDAFLEAHLDAGETSHPGDFDPDFDPDFGEGFDYAANQEQTPTAPPALFVVPDDPSGLIAGTGLYRDVPDPSVCARTATMNLTRMGVGQRLVVHYGHMLAYRPDLRAWMTFDGVRWVADPGSIHARALVRSVVRAIGEHEPAHRMRLDEGVLLAEAAVEQARASGFPTGAFEADAAMKRSEARKAIDSFAAKAEDYSTAIFNTILDGAVEALLVPESKWDRNPYLVNTPTGGTIDLTQGAKGEVVARAYDPTDYLTHVTARDFNPRAMEDPQAAADLARIRTHFDQAGEGTFKALLRYQGYGITGLMAAKAFMHIYGAGDSGKSTLAEACFNAAGTYAVTISPEDLYVNGGGQRPQPALDACRGARMIHVGEAQHGHLASDLLKRWTGGDRINTRTLNAPGGTWSPSGKFTLFGNGPVGLDGHDGALVARLIPVEVQPVQGPMDRTLPTRLREGDAVFYQMMKAARAYVWDVLSGVDAKAALCVPEATAARRRAYTAVSNPLTEWVASEGVAVGPEEDLLARYGDSGRVTQGQAHSAFLMWAGRSEGRRLTISNFRRYLPLAAPSVATGPETEVRVNTTETGGVVTVKGKIQTGIRIIDIGTWVAVTSRRNLGATGVSASPGA